MKISPLQNSLSASLVELLPNRSKTEKNSLVTSSVNSLSSNKFEANSLTTRLLAPSFAISAPAASAQEAETEPNTLLEDLDTAEASLREVEDLLTEQKQLVSLLEDPKALTQEQKSVVREVIPLVAEDIDRVVQESQSKTEAPLLNGQFEVTSFPTQTNLPNFSAEALKVDSFQDLEAPAGIQEAKESINQALTKVSETLNLIERGRALETSRQVVDIQTSLFQARLSQGSFFPSLTKK